MRNYALFLVLLQTGLRISELLAINLRQYDGKHFKNVKRKGKVVSRKVFIAKEARDALDRYIKEGCGKNAGVLFCSKSGRELPRQAVDDGLNAIATQASTNLPKRNISTSQPTCSGIHFFAKSLESTELNTPRNSPDTALTATYGGMFSRVTLRKKKPLTTCSDDEKSPAQKPLTRLTYCGRRVAQMQAFGCQNTVAACVTGLVPIVWCTILLRFLIVNLLLMRSTDSNVETQVNPRRSCRVRAC